MRLKTVYKLDFSTLESNESRDFLIVGHDMLVYS